MKNKIKTVVVLLFGCGIFATFRPMPLQACSIFVLVDDRQVLFGNNEDWSNPHTRIWFEPAIKGGFGSVYVGFDNNWAQGGMNTEGLAFDWVAGFKEPYQPASNMQPIRGNSGQRMLETCATVDAAIAFYRTNREPTFSSAKILVADRSGASVIIGAKDNQLSFERTNISRGFGYGGETLQGMLSRNPSASLSNAVQILNACVQSGTYATKYANVFDLKSRRIVVFPSVEPKRSITLDLAAELAKGDHYFDMPDFEVQSKESLRHFPSLAHAVPMIDPQPELTARVRSLTQDVINGTPRQEDYADELWPVISQNLSGLQRDLRDFGDLVSVSLADRSEQEGRRTCRFIVQFKAGRLLQRVTFDSRNRVCDAATEDIR